MSAFSGRAVLLPLLAILALWLAWLLSPALGAQDSHDMVHVRGAPASGDTGQAYGDDHQESGLVQTDAGDALEVVHVHGDRHDHVMHHGASAHMLDEAHHGDAHAEHVYEAGHYHTPDHDAPRPHEAHESGE